MEIGLSDHRSKVSVKGGEASWELDSNRVVVCPEREARCFFRRTAAETKSCRAQCQKMKRKGELKPDITIEQCTEALCKE